MTISEANGSGLRTTRGNACGRVADARGYLSESASAAEGLFEILRAYNRQKLRAIVDLVNASGNPLAEAQPIIADIEANRVAREVIAGSILQIAFHGVKRFGLVWEKPLPVMEFERQINDMIQRPPHGEKLRTRKKFNFPKEFCGGRQIGGMPIGLIIYAGRNQYCHAQDDRLNRDNELVFNYLQMLHPNPPNGLSFDIYDGWGYYAYSVLCALGWIDTISGEREVSAYERYTSDMELLLMGADEGKE